MQSVSEPTIGKPSFKDIFSLPFLFERAVLTDFSFYSEQVKKRIIRKNSLLRLFFACIRKQRVLLVAKVEGKCVGLIISSCNANIGVIHWLFVLPEHRGKKIGFNLVEKAGDELQKLGCHKITLTTEIASEFYKKLGYIEEGVLKKHWWEKDFTIMSKIFSKSVPL